VKRGTTTERKTRNARITKYQGIPNYQASFGASLFSSFCRGFVRGVHCFYRLVFAFSLIRHFSSFFLVHSQTLLRYFIVYRMRRAFCIVCVFGVCVFPFLHERLHLFDIVTDEQTTEKAVGCHNDTKEKGNGWVRWCLCLVMCKLLRTTLIFSFVWRWVWEIIFARMERYSMMCFAFANIVPRYQFEFARLRAFRVFSVLSWDCSACHLNILFAITACVCLLLVCVLCCSITLLAWIIHTRLCFSLCLAFTYLESHKNDILCLCVVFLRLLLPLR